MSTSTDATTANNDDGGVFHGEGNEDVSQATTASGARGGTTDSSNYRMWSGAAGERETREGKEMGREGGEDVPQAAATSGAGAVERGGITKSSSHWMRNRATGEGAAREGGKRDGAAQVVEERGAVGRRR